MSLCVGAFAQPSTTSGLINQQLDKQVKLNLSTTLPDAMTQITKQTGVPIDAQAAVWELLPWGKETSLTAKIENKTLREALHDITSKLGLVFVLKDESVELQPMPALRRLGRKSTASELEALDLLSRTQLASNTDKPTLGQLIEAVDLKLETTKTPFAIENRAATSPEKVDQKRLLAVPRNASLLEALEAINAQSTATWYPWGKNIVILPKQDQVRRQLQKEITLRFDGADVAQVLNELSSRSGVAFRYEPGAVASVPQQARVIRLVLEAQVIDALEAVSGLTGLGYVIKDDEVYIWNTAAANPAAPRDRTIAMITTDTGMQILITESQCPPDVKEFIEHQKKKQYEALRKMMQEQGFKPTTQPSKAEKPAGAGKDL
jgi:hypothetical protein